MKIRFIHIAALAGWLGPIVLAITLVVLSILEYDFMRSLRWHPITAPTTDWPSGLALGPLGGWMSATFVLSGLLIALFGAGLRQHLRHLQSPTRGATLLMWAGAAMAMLVLPTDPTYRNTPATLAGNLHDLAYILLGLTLFPAMILLARTFGKIPLWQWHSRATWRILALAIPAFIFKGVLFYGFLIGVMAWFVLVAWRLRATS